MRPAAEILLIESAALRAVLASTPREYLDRPTVCTGWSVRDVLAHCGAALTATAAGTTHSFSPADNERDVVERRSWPLDAVLAELYAGYSGAAVAIDVAAGALDGVGLGEWVHGGDVREALGSDDAYTSPGIELALPLLLERSALRRAPHVEVVIGDATHRFGVGGRIGALATDLETFVRLCGNRRPDPGRYRIDGATPQDLVLFG